MPSRPKRNTSVEHGAWGEAVAVERLRCEGLEIIERNARPIRDDRRLEVDVIAYEPKTDTMVFVEVKQHKSRSPWQKRLRSVDRRKRRLVKAACNAWRLRHRWTGGYRFDVIEVYGVPEAGTPEIDHIENVRLFETAERFIRW